MPLHYGVGTEELMNTVREYQVRRLMTAANDGMKSVAEGTTAEEVYAAYLSMARNAVVLAQETRPDNSDIRQALLDILALCEPPGKVH